MSYNQQQFRALIRQVLLEFELHSVDAEELLLGTAAVESDFGTNLEQIGGGPGAGAFQIEPETELSIWGDHLVYRPERLRLLMSISGVRDPSPWSLKTNLAYQIIIARLKYRMIPVVLPAADKIEDQADYWDLFYNCNPGKGYPADYIQKYRRYVAGRPSRLHAK